MKIAPPIIFPILTGIKLAAMPANEIVSGCGIIIEIDNNVIFATLCSKPDVIKANRHQKIIINFAVSSFNFTEHHTAKQTKIFQRNHQTIIHIKDQSILKLTV